MERLGPRPKRIHVPVHFETVYAGDRPPSGDGGGDDLLDGNPRGRADTVFITQRGGATAGGGGGAEGGGAGAPQLAQSSDLSWARAGRRGGAAVQPAAQRRYPPAGASRSSGAACASPQAPSLPPIRASLLSRQQEDVQAQQDGQDAAGDDGEALRCAHRSVPAWALSMRVPHRLACAQSRRALGDRMGGCPA